MPTKHIKDSIWRKVEQETVKAVIEIKEPVKDTEILEWIILKGLEAMKPEDYLRFYKKRKC